jgi:hypothetical protein
MEIIKKSVTQIIPQKKVWKSYFHYW